MANLRLFETPVQARAKLDSVFPVLDQILKEYCKAVTYWKVYTVEHTLVIYVENNIETVALMANEKTSISQDEIDFVAEKLLDPAKELSQTPINVADYQQYQEKYHRKYKEIVLLKQYNI